MTYKSFADYVKSFKAYDDHLALTIRTFIKTERVTYADLRGRVYQIAHYLELEGLKPGDRIMVIGASSPQWVELFLGAQLIGVTVVSVDVQSSLETVLGYAKRTEPRHIFKSRYVLPKLETTYKTTVLEEIDSLSASQKQTPSQYELTGEEIAVIVFTSGTIADPKGAALTQRNILANVSGVQKALTIDPNWRLLSVLPLSHMYELTGGCLAPLSSGASIFYMPRVTPLAIVRGLKDYEITTLLAVPQLLIQFLAHIKQTAEQTGKGTLFEHLLRVAGALPFEVRRVLFRSVHKGLGGHLRMVVTGGAPIPFEIATAWERMGVRMVQGYGLTETSPILAVNNPKTRRLDSQGRPLGNIELRLDPITNEIQAKGPSIFTSYWQNKEATKAAFTEAGLKLVMSVV
jgi:long-chain acyl-CoA synthetase